MLLGISSVYRFSSKIEVSPWVASDCGWLLYVAADVELGCVMLDCGWLLYVAVGVVLGCVMLDWKLQL